MDSSIVRPAAAQRLESSTLLRRCASRLCSSRGASAVEYGLLVGLIAIVIIGAVAVLGFNLGGLYDEAATSLSAI